MHNVSNGCRLDRGTLRLEGGSVLCQVRPQPLGTCNVSIADHLSWQEAQEKLSKVYHKLLACGFRFISFIAGMNAMLRVVIR